MQRVAFTAGVLLAIQFCFQGAVFAQSAGDVLKSFRNLQAGVETGMSRSEYMRGMAEVTAQLRNFSDANQGKPTPEMLKALSAAFMHYQKAKSVLDEELILDQRYRNNELSISTYFGRKREILTETSTFWQTASDEIDRAAKLPRK